MSFAMAAPDSTPLHERRCVVCKPGTPHLTSAEVGHLLGRLDGWQVEDADGHLQLTKVYKFKGFMPGVDLINRIAQVAEAEQHHPDVRLSWGSVTVWLWTHAAKGLTENDFVMAAKLDRL